MIRHTQVKLHHLKPQTLKHVEIIKLSDKCTCDTSLGSSYLEITDSEYQNDPTSSCEIIPSQTSNLKLVEIIKLSDKRTCDVSLKSS